MLRLHNEWHIGKTIFLWTLRRLPLALLPGVLVLALESMSRNSWPAAIEWITGHPGEWTLNYGIALSITLLTVAVLGRTRLAYLLLLLLCGGLGFASGAKMNRTGTPLYLWDLILPGWTWDPVRTLNPLFTIELLYIAAALLACICLLALLGRFIQVRLYPAERAAWGILALCLLVSYCRDFPIPFKKNAGIFTITWDQADNYERNGYLLASAMGVELIGIDKPSRMNRTDIRRLVRSITPAEIPTLEDGGRKPNIIVILSESFWDPSQMKNVSFSEDPLPFFRSLMQEYTGGSILSTQFGGGTANVEFEVLSGSTLRFLPKDSIAYISYMNRGVDSLASILARQGYTSTAFNPFFNWFFNSRNVYRHFGFSRFISSEFFDPIYHGTNIEDKQVMDRVMELTGQTDGPDFVFANTMENHGPYKNKFGTTTIKVTGPVSDESRNILENYATGVRAFDDAFRSLIEYYAASPEPTIVLSFGDHLPTLGDNFQVYRDAKYITGKEDPSFPELMYTTPFVIWSNDAAGSGSAKETLKLSPCYLGPYLLRLAGRPGTYYTDYLYALSQRIPVIPTARDYGKRDIDEKDLADYKRLQYDILFGKQVGYDEEGIRGSIIDAGYELGYGKPRVDRAVRLEDGRLEVTGDYFTDDCSVWLKGRELSTTMRDTHKLTATLPKQDSSSSKDADTDSASGPSALEFEVRLTDYKNTIIAKSEPFRISEGGGE